MPPLQYPAPESWLTEGGVTVHRWPRAHAAAEPLVLIHGSASSALHNWVRTGWVKSVSALERDLVAVDLPGHGASREINPAGVRTADLLQDLHQLVERLGGSASLHGYSLGARLAWHFAFAHPQHVARLVLGGAPTSDRLHQVDAAQARRWAAGGPEPKDNLTRELITTAASLPDVHRVHAVELRLSLTQDIMDPAATVPRVPSLVVAGDRDQIAAGSERLVELIRSAGNAAEFVALPGRDHISAITSAQYKKAVTQFLHRSAGQPHGLED